MDGVRVNLYFFKEEVNYDFFIRKYNDPSFKPFKSGFSYPGLAFSGIHYPLVSGDVMRFKDNNGLQHITSISKYFTTVIEEIEP